MSTAVQSHHTAAKAGVSRRPVAVAALLLPAAPLVLLVLAAVFFGLAARHTLRIRTVADDAAAPTPAASHEAATPARRGVMATLRPTSKRALVGAAAIAAGVLFASTSAAGSFAFLNSKASLATATVTSGSLGVSISAGGGTAGSAVSFPTAAYAAMLPGDVREQSVTFTNTGNANTNITVALAAAVNSSFQIRLLTSACTGTLSTAAVLTTTAASYGSLAAGASTTGCLQVALPASATVAQGTSATFTINVTGTEASS